MEIVRLNGLNSALHRLLTQVVAGMKEEEEESSGGEGLVSNCKQLQCVS